MKLSLDYDFNVYVNLDMVTFALSKENVIRVYFNNRTEKDFEFASAESAKENFKQFFFNK